MYHFYAHYVFRDEYVDLLFVRDVTNPRNFVASLPIHVPHPLYVLSSYALGYSLSLNTVADQRIGDILAVYKDRTFVEQILLIKLDVIVLQRTRYSVMTTPLYCRLEDVRR